MSDAIPNSGECPCPAHVGAVETGVFVMSKGRFARAMLARFGLRWWIAILALLIAGSAAAAVVADWRWIVVALMLALIITPMAAAFLYFSFGLRRECYVNILPHSAVISPSGIEVALRVPVVADYDEARSGETDGEDDGTGPEPIPPRIYSEAFAPACFGGYTVDSEGITLEILTPGRGFLRLPYSAFASKEEFAAAVGIIADYRAHNHQTKPDIIP